MDLQGEPAQESIEPVDPMAESTAENSTELPSEPLMDTADYRVGFAQDRNKVSPYINAINQRNTEGRWRYVSVFESMMFKDAHSFIAGFNGSADQGWFAVYDGHAGKSAAEYCGEHLHNTFIANLSPDIDPLTTFNTTFLATDTQMLERKNIYSGCCAVCCYIRVEQRVLPDSDTPTTVRVLYSANAGDARAVLSRNGVALRLTYDHKGSDENEAKRISEAGGFVLKNRVNGVLAVTRSLGDQSLKEWVIGNPFTSEVILSSTDTYLIVACDGVWDVMTDQEVVDLVAGKDEQQAADDILETSLEKLSTDNLSVIVVKIRALDGTSALPDS